MVKSRVYGCSSIIKALCLMFELAGHGLQCKLARSKSGQWVVEAEVRTVTRPSVVCNCRQGRDPCSCGKVGTSRLKALRSRLRHGAQ